MENIKFYKRFSIKGDSAESELSFNVYINKTESEYNIWDELVIQGRFIDFMLLVTGRTTQINSDIINFNAPYSVSMDIEWLKDNTLSTLCDSVEKYFDYFQSSESHPNELVDLIRNKLENDFYVGEHCYLREIAKWITKTD